MSGPGRKKDKEPQRASTRARVVSKSMRYVDEDTRREVRERAIQMLEADNYNEDQYNEGADNDNDGGAYKGGNDSGNIQKKKKTKMGNADFWGKKWKLMKIKPLERMIVEQGYDMSKRLSSSDGGDGEVDEQHDDFVDNSDDMVEDSDDEGGGRRGRRSKVSNFEDAAATSGSSISFPNYVSVAAGPSRYPPRHFCSICGYLGKYSCVRCGSKYCSIKCNKTHAEMRCMKFGTSI
jgi:hypothetical protein